MAGSEQLIRNPPWTKEAYEWLASPEARARGLGLCRFLFALALVPFAIFYVWGDLDPMKFRTHLFELGDSLHLLWVMDTVSHALLNGEITGPIFSIPIRWISSTQR